MELNHPASEVILGYPGACLTWLMLIGGLSAFGYIILKRYRLLRKGEKDPRWSDFRERIVGLVKDGILQRRQPRYLFAGVLHIIIFWGFVVLALHSFELLVSGLWPGVSLPFMEGVFGRVYNSLKDLFALVVLATVIIAAYRRGVLKPER
jgi:hypothetical protein